MKQRGLDFIKNELQIFIALMPIWVILDRTLRYGGLDLKLLISVSIAALITFFIFWFIINWEQYFVKYLNVLGVIIFVLGSILWLFWPELLAIYILGSGISLINMLLESRKLGGTNNENKYTWKGVIYFQIISFMGFSISFIIAVYFWDNLIVNITILSGIFSVILILYINSKNKNENKMRDEKTITYIPQSGILEIFIPTIISLLLFLLFRGMFFFIPFDFKSGKLLAVIILAFISLFLSVIYQKIKRNNNSRYS